MLRRRTATRPGSAPRPSIRLVLATTLGAALVAATPGAAHAGTITDTDDVKDMAKLVNPAEGDFEPAPRHRVNDVKSTDLIHTSSRIGAVMTVAQLSKADALLWSVEITSSKGEKRMAYLRAQKGNWSGQLMVIDRATDESVDCGRHDIDYADDVVRITLPKDCIGGGRWMRFRVVAGKQTQNAQFIDDALLDRPLKDGDTDAVLSRRVYK